VKLPRYRTGDNALDATVAALVEQADSDAENRDLIFELIASAVRLAREDTDRGDLKMANAALKEMRHTFRVFGPVRAAHKVSIFGSARTKPDDPLYAQARRFAAEMAKRDWMVITGAGPGIMEAGIQGAGTDRAFGVSIRLPFEETVAQLGDGSKLVNFRYFFTRKLAFIKESDGFVLLPGGFGTLDEAFELLTLVQTGKAQPGPIVMLDVPGGTYWHRWRDFVERELLARSYVSEHDLDLVLITDNVDEAVHELVDYFANYHSQRFVGGRLVLRLRHVPEPAVLDALSHEFADIITQGGIEAVDISSDEREDHDALDIPRVALWFDRRNWARLRLLIDRLNVLAPDP
jgi:uncharacterized protein (TIGR00730 family)